MKQKELKEPKEYRKQKETTGLTEKEILFCRLCSQGENPREAAARAGYQKNAEKCALKLLERGEIKNEIKKLTEKSENRRMAANGLKKIAFGGISDAVRLMTDEAPGEIPDLDSLDLFMVQEIKKVKGGGIEIKFFDRIKALEMLCELETSADTDKAMPFYKALSAGARELYRGGEG